MASHKRRPRSRGGSESLADPPTSPSLTLEELQSVYEHVRRRRQTDRLLSPEERVLRQDLAQLIKYLKWLSRKGYSEQTIADLRRAQRMQDRLDGIPGVGHTAKVDAQVAKDWDETRDRSDLAPRRTLPRGGIRQVVRGGAPSLGRRA